MLGKLGHLHFMLDECLTPDFLRKTVHEMIPWSRTCLKKWVPKDIKNTRSCNIIEMICNAYLMYNICLVWSIWIQYRNRTTTIGYQTMEAEIRKPSTY